MIKIRDNALDCVVKCKNANIVQLLKDATAVCGCIDTGGKKMKLVESLE
jgi:hypothetical protein